MQLAACARKKKHMRGVFQDLPRAWLLGNHSLTPVVSGRTQDAGIPGHVNYSI